MATPVLMTAMATHYAAQVASISMHTADPGTTGANEVTGGAPAYARKAAAWTINGTVADAASVPFDLPATTIAYIGMWNAGGQFVDSVPYTATLVAQGTLAITLHYDYESVTVGA